MEWYWYVATPFEILLDLDSQFRYQLAHKKLLRAQSQGALRITDLWAAPSFSDGKYHAVASISNRLSPRERIMWAWWAGSDPIRALYNLTRIERGVLSPDLLITPHKWNTFWRPADHKCNCETKHKGLDACRACPVFRLIHGIHAGAAYYPLEEKFEFHAGMQAWPLRKD